MNKKLKEIEQVFQLASEMIDEGKLSEALEILNALEPIDEYTERQKAIFYSLKSEIHWFLGNYPKAYETAEKGRQMAKNIERSIEVIDLFLNMALISVGMGKFFESLNLLEESAEILQNLPQISEKDRKQRTGIIYLIKGADFHYLGEMMNAIEMLKVAIDLLEKWGPQTHLAIAYALCGGSEFRFLGDYNKSLNYIVKSQKICENQESPYYNTAKLICLREKSIILSIKGDLKLALETAKKTVSLARTYNNSIYTHVGLNIIGLIHHELGEWDQAIKYYKEALSIAENSGIAISILDILTNILEIYINRGEITAAQQIFHEMEQYRDKEKDNKYMDLIYRFGKALLLKVSKRTRDLGGAQAIFKNITNEEVISIGYTQRATLHLCEMLLDEFNDTKNIEAFDEFSSLLTCMQKVAEKQHAYKILAETYLLEAKLSMIHFDMKKARHSLTQAQQIAERYELNRLAINISNEHDKLLQNLEVWEQMENENVPISERLEKIDLSDQILTQLKQKPGEIPDTTLESPIFILIMANSGIPLYTKIFSKELEITEELFSGFLSAFNTFSDEIFSEGLDRANFGKYTILMTSLPPFRSCYVFKGQSFLAQQKFSQFNEKLYNSEQIWKKLTSANRTGQVIKDDASKGLGQLVKSTF